MIDKVEILIQAGNGGKGCESYFRRTDRKTVPSGGTGGKGGSILFRADPNAPPIAQFCYKRHMIAESGSHGGSMKKRGKNGEDLTFLVPVGTRLYNKSQDLLIRDWMKTGEEVVVVEGGRGGAGNQGGKEAKPGEPGAMIELEITVRLPVDVALIGLPNSGKSSLLNSLSRAHAKVEAYPFATREPEMAVCDFLDYEQLKLCEMPSLYRGSHEGRGLGNEFLKHLEMVRFVLYVLDPVSEFVASLQEGLAVLKKEVSVVSSRFVELPYAVVINKIDAPGARERITAEKWKADARTFYVSAQTGEGLEQLKEFLQELIVRE
jgi:GTP-binding protein